MSHALATAESLDRVIVVRVFLDRDAFCVPDAPPIPIVGVNIGVDFLIREIFDAEHLNGVLTGRKTKAIARFYRRRAQERERRKPLRHTYWQVQPGDCLHCSLIYSLIWLYDDLLPPGSQHRYSVISLVCLPYVNEIGPIPLVRMRFTVARVRPDRSPCFMIVINPALAARWSVGRLGRP